MFSRKQLDFTRNSQRDFEQFYHIVFADHANPAKSLINSSRIVLSTANFFNFYDGITDIFQLKNNVVWQIVWSLIKLVCKVLTKNWSCKILLKSSYVQFLVLRVSHSGYFFTHYPLKCALSTCFARRFFILPRTLPLLNYCFLMTLVSVDIGHAEIRPDCQLYVLDVEKFT